MKWWRQSALVLGISMWQPVSRRSSSVGEMVPVRITGAMAYDLIGTVPTNSPQVITLDDLQTGAD